MTSFILKAHEDRKPPPWGADAAHCAFCGIVAGTTPAFRLYENEAVVAILDIAPLRWGHTLIIPKAHIARLSELPDQIAGECGIAVSKVARAITEVLQNTALNVVCNQEYAQAVPHVHYHIIPAPMFGPDPVSDATERVAKPLTEKEMHALELQGREALDQDAARDLVVAIRVRLEKSS